MTKIKDNLVPSLDKLTREELHQAIELIKYAKKNLRISMQGLVITKSLLDKLQNGVETNKEQPKQYFKRCNCEQSSECDMTCM